MPLHGAIDVDRGVTMRQVVAFDSVNPSKFMPDPKFGGLTVYMYKDEPGIYYDVHGNKLPDGMAKIAGFPVDKLAKQRMKREAMTRFEQQLRAQLELETAEADVILAEDGNWQVIELPMERAKVVDKTTGEPVTAVPMPKADAILFLQLLTEAKAEANVEVQEPKGAKSGSTQA